MFVLRYFGQTGIVNAIAIAGKPSLNESGGANQWAGSLPEKLPEFFVCAKLDSGLHFLTGRGVFKPKRSIRKRLSTDLHPFTDYPFLVASGLGRSGTTVLRNCLCAHPLIASCNLESNYIHDLMRAADQNLEYEDRVKNMPVSTADYWSLHRQLLLNLVWPLDQSEAPESKKAIATYSMLDPRAAIGLKKTFQKVAICYIIRNGIEVVSSYLSFAPFREMGFDQVCRLWALRHDMFQFANNHPHVFLFRHEWFQHPQQFRNQLSAAFSFVGLEYDIECDKPVNTVFHPTVFAGESREAASDISRRNERWKYWSSNQREIFVEICGKAMHAQGYQIPWL